MEELKIKDIEHHFDDEETTQTDRDLGEKLSYHIGDTFLHHRNTPVEQWTIISKALRIHGLMISEQR